MLNKIAHIISVIFHPLLIPSLGVVFILFSDSSSFILPLELKRLIFYLVCILTFILPVSIVPFLKIHGFIETLKMSNTRERLLPLLITGILYLTCYYLLNRFPVVPKYIKAFILATAFSVFVTFIITYFWKISIHMVGMGGLSGIILASIVYLPLFIHLYVISAFLVSGLIGTTRLFLKEHVPLQIYSGYLLGLFTVLAVIILYN